MQCYTASGTAQSTTIFVSVRYLRGYAVLPLFKAWGLVGQILFQSAICADMQCYR